MRHLGTALGLTAMMMGSAAAASDSAVSRSPRPELRPEGTAMQEQVVPAVANRAFKRWIEGFRARALARGISAATFDTAFRGVEYDTDVIAKDRNQSEFTKTIWDYLDSAASATRVANGKAALHKYARTLNAIAAISRSSRRWRRGPSTAAAAASSRAS